MSVNVARRLLMEHLLEKMDRTQLCKWAWKPVSPHNAEPFDPTRARVLTLEDRTVTRIFCGADYVTSDAEWIAALNPETAAELLKVEGAAHRIIGRVRTIRLLLNTIRDRLSVEDQGKHDGDFGLADHLLEQTLRLARSGFIE